MSAFFVCVCVCADVLCGVCVCVRLYGFIYVWLGCDLLCVCGPLLRYGTKTLASRVKKYSIKQT